MTVNENDLLLKLLEKWRTEETDKALRMDTTIVNHTTQLILKLQNAGAEDLDEAYSEFERIGNLLDKANAGDDEAALILLDE